MVHNANSAHVSSIRINAWVDIVWSSDQDILPPLTNPCIVGCAPWLRNKVAASGAFRKPSARLGLSCVICNSACLSTASKDD